MNEAAIWAMEERFWLGGTEFLERMLDPQCVMAFPGAGILQGAAIIESLRDAPRWNSVEMDARILALSDAEDPDTSRRDRDKPAEAAPADPRPRRSRAGTKASMIVLGYRAKAWRENGPPYRVLCTSTYRADDDGWKLVQHQQSPVE